MKLSQLDSTFSKYIRFKESDHRGFVKCCTCPTVKHWKEMQCGHYYSRSHMKTRWDERNAHAQCHECNCIKFGNLDVYSEFMNQKYTTQDIDELWQFVFWRFDGFMQYEIDELTKYYKNKIKQL